MHNPMEAQMHIPIRILPYIQGTQQYGLHIYLSSTTSLILSTYVDWRWCPDTRCSTYGYCVFLGDNLLYWSSKRQLILSRFNAKVEYRGITTWFLNHVGCATLFSNYIALFKRPFWSTLTTSMWYIYLWKLHSTSKNQTHRNKYSFYSKKSSLRSCQYFSYPLTISNYK